MEVSASGGITQSKTVWQSLQGLSSIAKSCIIGTFICVLTTILSTPAQESPFRFSWPVETTLLAGGVAGDALGQYRVSGMTPPRPSDLRRGDLAPWDRFFAGRYDAKLATASTILTFGVTGTLLYVDAWEKASGRAGWKPFLEDGLIISEALAWSGALNLNARAFQIHPRPLAYDSAAPASIRNSRDAGGAFYSGHASAAFMGAACFATIYPLRHPEFQHAGWLWVGSMAAASTVAVLRVASGKHFPSDVVTGAAVGTLLGWGFPKLHQSMKNGSLKAWSLSAWPSAGNDAGFTIQAARPVADW